MSEPRDIVVEFLKEELVGPVDELEILDSSPCQRYSAGILFPPRQLSDSLDDLSEPAEEPIEQEPDEIPFDAGALLDGREPRRKKVDQGEGEQDETVLLANSFLPSAIGLTFLVGESVRTLNLNVRAAVYESRPSASGFGREWTRKPLELPGFGLVLDPELRSSSEERDLHQGKLFFRMVRRRRRDRAQLVTVTLYNKSTDCREPPRPDACFFQVGFRVEGEVSGAFLPLPAVPRSGLDLEELALDLLYRRRRSFARGHGCAASWSGHPERADRIETATIPSIKIPSIQPRSETKTHTSMEFLGNLGLADPSRQIPDTLERLADDYQSWIENLKLGSVPVQFHEIAEQHVDGCSEILDRIRAGIDLLRRDQRCLRAFMLANRAILVQQYHYRRPRRLPGEDLQPFPEAYRSIAEAGRGFGYWRNFQLAFILMNLSAFTADRNEQHRDIVDLIWFPTGGGKTEAYLGLAAYSIFLRRLRGQSPAGVTVLMRYTLRLLTAQQFQRASSLICACEELRAQFPDELGRETISIGLWVGESLTPNSRQEALKGLRELEKGDRYQRNPFQMLTCPWCGTALDQKPLAYRRDRLRGSQTVRIICPERSCSFSSPRRPLPVLVIDEDIYASPPTLVISTVDKFAMLAWKPKTRHLFGAGRNPPPDLIIQDELHLISGPLGSMVGIYEAVIDLLCTRDQRPPKIVASTATIRRAREQCRALYGREAVQFPPPGLDISDSWFAEENQEIPGRQYVGILPTAAPSPVTSLVRGAAALLQGAKLVPIDEGQDESLRDPYWTLVQYFSSLRELGRASTLVEADIPEQIKVIARRRDLESSQVRWVGYPVELTSRLSASEIPRILERLEVPLGPRGAHRPLDTLLATNMISVGVDIDRLGLMLVVGQPKSTSEYIQATSRVGRSRSAPGLVVTLYNAGKPRDRSHYEQFHHFHETFYRQVEPTSITPFSLPVLDRALHAVLVIAARHIQRIDRTEDFDPEDPAVVGFRDHLVQRMRSVNASQTGYLEKRLDRLARLWRRSPPKNWGGFGRAPEERPLMYPAGSEPREEWGGHAWATPTSMRNVDAECQPMVLQIYPEREGVKT